MRLTSTEIRHGGSMLGKPLGEREREVLGFIVAGMTNEEIGDVLVVSKHTAHDYVERAFRKLGARNRTAAAVMAIGHGVVEMPAWAKPPQPAKMQADALTSRSFGSVEQRQDCSLHQQIGAAMVAGLAGGKGGAA